MKNIFLPITIALLLFSCSACSEKSEIENIVESDGEKTVVEQIAQQAPQTFVDIYSENQLDALQSELNDNFNTFCRNFAIEAIKQTNPDANTICSPTCAAIVATMIANGASEDYRSSAIELFGCDVLDAFTLYAGKINKSISNRRNYVFLSSVNSLWCDMDVAPDAQYVDLLDKAFSAPVNRIEMNSNNAGSIINSWANKHTNGLIPKVVSDGPLYNWRAVWANALYLEGEWSDKFDKSLTKRETFHGTLGDSSVDMMHQKFDSATGNIIDDFTIMKIFMSPAVSFVMVLPPEGMALDAAAEKFLGEILPDIEYVHVPADLALPRLDVASEILTGQVLEKMGLPASVAMPGLNISDDLPLYSLQKASLHLDEDGATAGLVGLTGYGMSDGTPQVVEYINMYIDRPFLYFIMAELTETMLFSGKVTNID